jgi:hypothetical protein
LDDEVDSVSGLGLEDRGILADGDIIESERFVHHLAIVLSGSFRTLAPSATNHSFCCLQTPVFDFFAVFALRSTLSTLVKIDTAAVSREVFREVFRSRVR